MTQRVISGRRAALASVLGVLFLTFLDTTVVSVTLGNMQSDLKAGIIPLQWVINAYALTFAALMLVGGSLSDRYGRKWLMLGGIVVFCLGSAIAGFAGSVTVVIIGRAVMGVGAAACEPGTLSVIRQLFDDRKERARALGAWSAVSGLALALGPVVGGVLVGLDSWRSVFWFNLALGAVLAALVWRFVPNSADPRAGRPDLAGFALGTVGIGGVVYAVIAGEYKGFTTWWVVALFVLGGACVLAFGPVESRVRAPMLDLSVIRKPIITSALFAAFAVYFAVFAIFFLTALYLDLGLKYSGLKLAAMFTPMAVTIVAGGLVAGPWVARRGTRTPATVGCLIAAVGLMLAWAVIGSGADTAHDVAATASFGLLAVAIAVAGLGFGVTVVPLTSAVLSHVPARMSGMGASATNTARQLGAVVGVAALGAIANAHLVTTLKGFGLLGASQVPTLETGGASLTSVPDVVLRPFVHSFADGLQVALIVASALIVLAGIGAALVREPGEGAAGAAGAAEAGEAQAISTGGTDCGSAPPRIASTGSA